MDESMKKKLAEMRVLIQQKKYQEALSDLEVVVYKYPKLYQIHLMAALCYQKCNRILDAEKSYLEALDLKPEEPNAIKELSEVYKAKGDRSNHLKYAETYAAILKKTDLKKYKEAVIKLVDIYQKDENLEKIDAFFQDYISNEIEIGEDFVKIAQAYFQVGVTNQCFNLQKFEEMAIRGENCRLIVPSAKQQLSLLLIDVVNYLYAVARQYQLTSKDLANSLFQLKSYFSEVPCILLLILFEDYCVGHLGYSSVIFQEIYKLLSSYFGKIESCYSNLEFTSPEIFTALMVLSYQYLAFFKQFFTLDECFSIYFNLLAENLSQLQENVKIRNQYIRKMNRFILKECRQFHQNPGKGEEMEKKLEELKEKILVLDGSYLEEIIAKISLNCIHSYEEIIQMKNLLKVRIKNSKEDESVVHLYKYYYEYLIKIARHYKALDEEIPISNVLSFIVAHDPNPKYLLQKIWLNFSRLARDGCEEKQIRTLENEVSGMLNSLVQSDKSDALRRLIILKLFEGKAGDGEMVEHLTELLKLERSFANLQCASFYLYHQGNVKEALPMLKEAFVLNQTHYHLNRLLFLCFYKLNLQKEAISFLQRIVEGFSFVFWINYLLGTHQMNLGQFADAEITLNRAFQCFEVGVSKNYRFSFQKTIDKQDLAFPLMIQQNDISILLDEIVFSENYIFDQWHLLSTHIFKKGVQKTQIQLFNKLSEVLKITGRTKSALNYLQNSYTLYQQVSQSNQLSELYGRPFDLQLCLMLKQYSTILFYTRNLPLSEKISVEAGQMCSLLIAANPDHCIFRKFEAEIKSLQLEMAIEKLQIILKFQSKEYIKGYFLDFWTRNSELLVVPRQASLNYLKNEYKLNILQCLFDESKVSQKKALVTVQQFIRRVLGEDIAVEDIESIKFENRVIDLSCDKRVDLIEAIEDYLILVLLLNQEAGCLQSQILKLIQLFPKRPTLYILFGSIAENSETGTASLVRCLQLDRYNQRGISLLSELYLKESKYIESCKLFLKCLEMNITDVKSYVGLVVCLFCSIFKSLSEGTTVKEVWIEQLINKINSYLDYIKIVDPSHSYQLLQALTLLFTSSNSSLHLIKFSLQTQFQENTTFHHFNEVFRRAVHSWKELSLWREDHHQEIIHTYFANNQTQTQTSIENMITQCEAEISSLRLHSHLLNTQIGERKICKILNQIGVILNLLQQAKPTNEVQNQRHLNRLARSCSELEQYAQFSSQESRSFKKIIKERFVDCIFSNGSHLLSLDMITRSQQLLDSVFPSIPVFTSLTKYSNRFSEKHLIKCILLSLLKYPHHDEIRSIYVNFRIVQKSQHLRVKHQLKYEVELLNVLNESASVAKEHIVFKKMCLLHPDRSSHWVEYCHSRIKANREETQIRSLSKLVEYLLCKKESRILAKLQALALEIKCVESVGLPQNLEVGEEYLIRNCKRALHEVERRGGRIMKGEKHNLEKLKVWSGKDLNSEMKDYCEWSCLNLLQSLVCNLELDQTVISNILQKCKQAFRQDSLKMGVLHLIEFLGRSQNADLVSEESLTEEVMAINRIETDAKDLIHPIAFSIIKLGGHLALSNYEELEQELAYVSEHQRIGTHQHQTILNLYDLLKAYRLAQKSMNESSLVDGFLWFIDQLIALIQNPFWQGFLLGLKGMLQSFIRLEGSNDATVDRNLKKCFLLSPTSSKSLRGAI